MVEQRADPKEQARQQRATAEKRRRDRALRQADDQRAGAIASEVLRPWRVGRRVGRTIYMVLGEGMSDDDV